jgi:hypothetical protein
LGGSQFKASLGKKLARPLLNKEAERGGARLAFQLCGARPPGNKKRGSIPRITQAKRPGAVVSVVERLLSTP